MNIYSLRVKIIMISIVAVVSVGVFGSFIIRERIDDIVLERMEKETKIIMDNTRISLLHLFEHDDEHVIEDIIGSFTDHDLVDSFQLCSSELETLYSSNLDEVGLISDNMCVVAVANKKVDIAAHFSLEDDVFEVAMPIENEFIDGILYAHLNNDYIHSILKDSENKLLLIFNGAVVVMTTVMAALVTFFVLKPISIIKNSTERVILEDYDTKIEINSRDEFEELATAFNHMIESIKEKTEILEERKKNAESSAEERLNFLAHMSHEIRTPLNSIFGFTSLLMERKNSGEDTKELKIIMSSCNHLQQVINEILDIAKYEQKQITFEEAPYSIRRLVYQVDGMFELRENSDAVEYTSSVDLNVPNFFIGDAYRIKEIMINLISNALKFTEKGYVRLKVIFENNQLVLSVEDSGIGIPLDKQDAVFEVFTQSDEATTRLYGGSGLGLAISKRLAQQMGGDLILESDGVTGTKFIFNLKPVIENNTEMMAQEEGYLMVERWLAADSLIRDIVLEYIPQIITQVKELRLLYDKNDINELREAIHKLKGACGNFKINEIYEEGQKFESYLFEQNPPYENAETYIGNLEDVISKIPKTFYEMNAPIIEQEEVNEGRVLKILLADDVLENRMLIRKILESERVAIDTVKDGQEAINMMKENHYDCLLLDIQMPVMSGEEVLRWLSKLPEKPVEYIITLTANARSEEMEMYMSLGSDDYLSKPIEKEDLRQKIRLLKKQLGN